MSKINLFSLIVFFVGLISPAICISDVLYAPDYSSRLDSSTGITVALKGKPKTKWLSDNITKTTIYTYADKTTFTVSQTVQPTITKSIKGLVQTSTITYGNKKKKTIKETGVLIAGSESMSGDLRSKNATYRFSNGDNIVIPTTLKGAPKVKWGSDNITKYTVFTYSDKSTYSTVSRVEPTTSTSWSTDHLVKTIAYNFANGKKSKLTEKIQPVTEVTYADDVQLTILKFGDGYVKQTSKKATSLSATWGSDNVTKTTTYTFANGEKNSLVTVVPGNESAPAYSGNTQTIVTTFGNGQTSSASQTASSSAISWASDNVTRTTTYTFANGGTNPVVDKVAAIKSTPALTAAVYPSNWTTTGTVLKPSVSSITNTFGNGVVSTLESGTSLLPFNQSSLSVQSITDPSAVVQSSTTDYNLIWGVPDKNGPAYSTAFNQGNSSFTYSAPLNIMGNSVQGLFVGSGPTFAAPHTDVIDAWNQGWTGKGVNVLVADGFIAPETHGVIVTSLVARYAIGATYFGIPLETYSQSSTNVFYIDGTRANLQTAINIGVINTSFGANYSNGTSDAARAIKDDLYATDRLRWTKILKGSVGHVYQGINLTDAVITKAAGNDAITSEKESYVKAYADDPSIKERLLIVGALSFDSNGKGFIASYSNTAGADSNVKSRFVTASGGTPFTTGDIYVNGTRVDGSDYGNLGTSFAAPRVAGYAAILRQKFPNLNAAKTSSIILDTARYDTLNCNPNCDPNIYGAGQASLSRALAPVGRLR